MLHLKSEHNSNETFKAFHWQTRYLLSLCMAACDRERIRSFVVLLSAYFLVASFFLLFLCDPSGGCHVCTINTMDG